MNSHRPKLRLAPVVVLALLMAACAGKTKVESDLRIAGAPDWVNKGTQFINDQDGRLFHGVGEAPEMGTADLQKTTADNRARAEVARILSSYMDAVSNDFTTASKASGNKAISEQVVSKQINSATKVNLAGVKIVARWKDKRTNIIYSLAELDKKDVDKTIELGKNMNADLKRYIQENSENIFDKVAQEKE